MRESLVHESATVREREPGRRQSGRLGLDNASPSLPRAVDGERRFVGFQGKRLALYLSVPGSLANAERTTPLVLVHSINAAASAAEVRPVFDRYARTRPVLALELPGFGSSDRLGWRFTPELMSESILKAVAFLKERGFHQPVDLMAVSLSAELAARAALAVPEAFRSVALVNPTGLESRRAERYEGGRSKAKPWLHWLLDNGPWANPLFRLLTSETSMRKFLERSWGSKDIDEGLLAYNLLTVREPGARHAPYAFIAGNLFTRGVAELYARLRQPVWLAHGSRGEFAKFDGLQRLGPPPHWTVDRFDTGAMPYFEVPESFAACYDAFSQRLPQPHAE